MQCSPCKYKFSTSLLWNFPHHANLDSILFALMLAVEKHTFAYYKKLPDNVELSWFDSPMCIKDSLDSQNVTKADRKEQRWYFR